MNATTYPSTCIYADGDTENVGYLMLAMCVYD